MEPCDSEWRGLGVIPGSGLVLRKEWEAFDARKNMRCRRSKANQIRPVAVAMCFRENANRRTAGYLEKSVPRSIR